MEKINPRNTRARKFEVGRPTTAKYTLSEMQAHSSSVGLPFAVSLGWCRHPKNNTCHVLYVHTRTSEARPRTRIIAGDITRVTSHHHLFIRFPSMPQAGGWGGRLT